MFYSNANAKLGNLGGSLVMDVCRKRGDCFRYRGRRDFREGQRREVVVVDLRRMQYVAIELCTAHLKTWIREDYIDLMGARHFEDVCQGSYR